jgi:HD-GYP domain-containing protein (c-di-GMP phosphodiesterase class II)
LLISEEAKPVTREELVLGQAVPWRLFDRDMRLLLREGTVITSEKQIDALLMRGALRYEVVEPQTRAKLREQHQRQQQAEEAMDNPFRPYHEFAERLQHIFDALVAEPNSLTGHIDDIRALAKSLFTLVEAEPELAIAVVHLVHEYRYHVIHPMHCAILLSLLEIRAQQPWPHTESVLCAALTQNIGMNAMQDELDNQLFELTEEQKQGIRRHPTLGVEMLEAAGVDDELWLTMVVQHHEQENGKGYPFNLAGEQIAEESRLLSLTDRYSAMLMERPDREGRSAQAIIKLLYRDSRFGENLTHMRLIRELGVYPPGTFVRLRSGETAHVVARSGGESGKTLVVSYINSRGMRLDPPRLRDTGSISHHAIKGPCRVDIEAFDMREVWGVVERYRRPK